MTAGGRFLIIAGEVEKAGQTPELDTKAAIDRVPDLRLPQEEP